MNFHTVTMIDDSRADAFLVQRAVSKISADIKFVWIGDAEEGYRHLLETRSDDRNLIILDIKMPKMTGLDILRELDHLGALQRLPRVIVLSSSSLDRDVNEAESYGNVVYRTKPEGFVGIRSMMQNLLEPAS